MFSIGKLRTRPWQITLIIFLALFLQSCGVPGSDSTLKEKNVAARDARVAYKKEAVDMKEAKRAGTERATFALGWFWGPDARFGHMEGVMRTQVGYAGGTKKNPTYHNLGDHSETIEIEFDPRKVSYEKLLDIFWESHESTAQPFSRQYASFIFFHTDEQKRKAQESKKQIEAKKRKKLFTEIVQAGTFYPAEDYHQKYYLRRYEALVKELSTLYAGQGDFTKSTAAAKVNGYLGGNGNLEQLAQQLKDIGLPAEAIDRIVGVLRGAGR